MLSLRRLNPIHGLSRSLLLFSSTPTSQFQPKPTETFDHATVRETLGCYANDWTSALEFFNWVETHRHFAHTTDTYNRMIDILGKFSEFDLSWVLINRMRGANPFSQPDHTTFRILFKRYVSAHFVLEAIDAYERLGEFDLKDERSFCNLIDALCEYRHVAEAHDLCFGKNRVVGFDRSTKIHNMILRGWFKKGWWRRCKEFWEEMDRNGVCKDLHSYSIYMDILCKTGKPWKAVKLYKEMKRKGMSLDVVAYNTVIRAVSLSEGIDSSMRVFREMKELGCDHSVVTFNIIIKFLCQDGRVQEACVILDKMPKMGCVPDVVTYHNIFGHLEKSKEIFTLFDRMVGSGVRPQMETYVMLMRKFGRWGFLPLVMTIWEKMEELGCSPDGFAYDALIDALVENGKLDTAQEYYDEMLAKGLPGKRKEELEIKRVESESSDDD